MTEDRTNPFFLFELGDCVFSFWDAKFEDTSGIGTKQANIAVDAVANDFRNDRRSPQAIMVNCMEIGRLYVRSHHGLGSSELID